MKIKVIFEGKSYICDGGNDGAQNAHDAVESNGDTITCPAMGAGKDLWGILIHISMIRAHSDKERIGSSTYGVQGPCSVRDHVSTCQIPRSSTVWLTIVYI